VICGNVLPKINNAKDVFHLDAPQFIDLAESPLKPAKDPAAEVQIDLDEGRVELLLFIDDEVVF
jgi:hypothetical protein